MVSLVATGGEPDTMVELEVTLSKAATVAGACVADEEPDPIFFAESTVPSEVHTLEVRRNTLGVKEWNGFGIWVHDPVTGVIDFEFDSQKFVDQGILEPRPAGAEISPDALPDCQHGLEVLGDDHLLVYDNGIGQPNSHAQEWLVDGERKPPSGCGSGRSRCGCSGFWATSTTAATAVCEGVHRDRGEVRTGQGALGVGRRPVFLYGAHPAA